MKYFIMIMVLLVAMGALSKESVSANKASNNEAIFVLIENGGTIASEEQKDAQNVIFNMLQQLTSLGRRKETRNAQIYIVLSSLPNRIAWSGTPRQLVEQTQAIKDLIVFKNSFSDLVVAFEQIETTINLTQPDNIRLYWIGSTINVPFQNSSKAIVIKVPQEVPANLALANFIDRLNVLKIMRVHPDQDVNMQKYLASIGALRKAKSGDLRFALLGYAQTKSSLKNLL